MSTTTEKSKPTAQTISPAELLEHWQGHRGLTRRVIEAFPDDAFFTYTIGGMRPFAEMVMEMMAIGAPALREIITGEQLDLREHFDHGNSKAKILEVWDQQTEEINEFFNQILLERFQETVTLFGQFTFPIWSQIAYAIDNEIHHRGQAYVYLRSLGIAPPLFYER
ncbi:MAG: DinB family protein [Bacteroidota bacterium]